MKKIGKLLISGIFLTGCTNPVRYFMGEREQDGLIFIHRLGLTTIIKFAEELQDDEFIYIPSSLRSDWSGEPLPIVIGGSPWLGGILESDALHVLYITGNQTTFDKSFDNRLDNLEIIVFNTLTPTFLPEIYPNDTLQDLLQYGFFIMYAHESYDGVVQFYHNYWNEQFGSQDWDTPVGPLASRVSYYFNYEGSPNEGLYRIGMEYEVGIDFTPPANPTRLKTKNVFGSEYYTFKGWSSDENTFIPYDFESSDDDIDVQLYAHWE